MTAARTTSAEDVRVWLARHRWTQQQLADRLGISRSGIHKWCVTETVPPAYLWRALEHLELELAART